MVCGTYKNGGEGEFVQSITASQSNFGTVNHVETKLRGFVPSLRKSCTTGICQFGGSRGKIRTFRPLLSDFVYFILRNSCGVC